MYSCKWLVTLCLCILLVCSTGCTDYRAGYNQAVQDVRQVRKSGNLASELAMKASVASGLIPTDSTKSADWNAGYREGLKEELAK